ncbi:MAG: DUF1826 domain-containing protein [Pseudomonadota bacterium]
MSTAREVANEGADGVVVCDAIEGFGTLREPSVSAVIWKREMNSGFLEWIGSLAVNRLPSARVVTTVAHLPKVMMAICNSVHVPYSMHRRVLIDDATRLAAHFADLMRVQAVRIRFDVVNDNACRKFHVDAVTARLVCTYRGPGTQYGNGMQGEEPSRIFSVPSGSPLLLRGTHWPEEVRAGLLHRSPPIEGEDITRLVFVVDPVDDIEAMRH